MMNTLRAVFKILLLILWTIPLVLIQMVVMLFSRDKGSYYVPQLWHRGIACIVRLKVEIDGVAPSSAQTIFVSNHLSYLDIFAIGSHLRASFVAKEDIAHWPVIGFLCTVQQTAFISRASREAKKVANSLGNMLKEGKSLILFPEGTSTSGQDMLPFKSSLFSLVQDSSNGQSVQIQPFTLQLLETDGKPLDPVTASWDLYSWYADMEFGPHFWAFLKQSGAKVRLTFHPVIVPSPADDRKTLAKAAWDSVSAGLPRRT